MLTAPLLPHMDSKEEPCAHEIVKRMKAIELTAQDNLLTAKIKQAAQANKDRRLIFPFQVGNRVVLSTMHR